MKSKVFFLDKMTAFKVKYEPKQAFYELVFDNGFFVQ